MKIKFFSLICLFFFSIIQLFCQQDHQHNHLCGTQPDLDKNIDTESYVSYVKKLQKEKNTNKSSTAIDTIYVQFHIVRNDDGTGGGSFAHCAQALDTFNLKYGVNMNYEFIECDTAHYIDNSALLNNANQDSLVKANEYNLHTINIYVVETIENAAGYVSSNPFLNPAVYGRFMVIEHPFLLSSTFSHEMGHMFFLYHTHGKYNNTWNHLIDSINGFPEALYFEGAVKYYGDSYDDNTNNIYDCYETGDNVCDTQAELPNMPYDVSCTYLGDTTDYFGETYIPESTIMSYAPSPCRDTFTNGQYDRMKWSYDLYHLNVQCGTCQDTISTDTAYVLNDNESGLGSLNWAITCANISGHVKYIHFNIPGNGPDTISYKNSFRPPILVPGLVIDATSQPNYYPGRITIERSTINSTTAISTDSVEIYGLQFIGNFGGVINILPGTKGIKIGAPGKENIFKGFLNLFDPIEDLSIKHNSFEGLGSIAFDRLTGTVNNSNSKNINISNNIFNTSGTNAIYLNEALDTIEDLTIKSNTIIMNSAHAGIITGLIKNGIISNNTVNGGIRSLSISRSINNLNIQNNTFKNATNGVHINKHASQSQIQSNEIFGHSLYGIYFHNSGQWDNTNILEGNNIYNNQTGIYLQHSHNNTIGANDVYNNTSRGIYNVGGDNLSIIGATIRDNSSDGIKLQNGCLNNVIDSCFIHDNSGDGFDLRDADNLTIQNSSIYNNSKGIQASYNCQNLNIIKNTIYDNLSSGIEATGNCTLMNVGDGTDGNKNLIYGNYMGVRLSGTSNNIAIHNNDIHGNDFGVYSYYTGEGSTILSNNIYSHILSGIQLNGSKIIEIGDGTLVGENNIFDNQSNGIAFSGDSIKIFRNKIFCQKEEDIELNGGANNGIVPPTIITATTTNITGTTSANFEVDIYRSRGYCTECSPEQFLGSVTADGSGNWNFTPVIDSFQYADKVTAIAQDGFRSSANSECKIIDVNFICSGYIDNFPFIESFEIGNASDFRQITDDDFEWTRWSGVTGTPNTGPSSAYDGSFYMYTDPGVNSLNSKAELITPCFDFFQGGDSLYLEFYYHMYGSGTGSLDLDISLDDGQSWTNIWSKNGDQGDLWIKDSLNLASYSNTQIIFKFEVNTTGNILGDIAIDAFKLDYYYNYFADSDGDGFGNPNISIGGGNTPPLGYVSDNTDCDDTDPDEFPGQLWYIDMDGDTYGGSTLIQCLRPTNGFLVTEITGNGTDDCDDTDPLINPAASETCGDNMDNDCNGLIDDVYTTNIWVGTAPANWYNDVSNWSLGVFPEYCHEVIIPANKHVTLQNGNIGKGYTLQVDQAATLEVKLNAVLDIIASN